MSAHEALSTVEQNGMSLSTCASLSVAQYSDNDETAEHHQTPAVSPLSDRAERKQAS